MGNKNFLLDGILKVSEDFLEVKGFDAANNEIYYLEDKPFTGFVADPYSEIEYKNGYRSRFERYFHDENNSKLHTEYHYSECSFDFHLKAWDENGILVHHSLRNNLTGKEIIYVNVERERNKT